MTRDIHRAPSRLASSRPESRWKTHSTLPSDQHPLPARGSVRRDPRDYDLEQDFIDGMAGASLVDAARTGAREPVYEPVAPEHDAHWQPLHDEPSSALDASHTRHETAYRTPAPGRANGHNGQAATVRSSRVVRPAEPDYAPPTPPPAPPRAAVEAEPSPAPYDFTETPVELSPSDQYQLLLYNIQLYDDDWKLARIRGTEHDRWMRAYLIPRDRKMEWEEARQRGQVLQIAIDNRGNTVIREPKKPGLLRRLLNWLYGR